MEATKAREVQRYADEIQAAAKARKLVAEAWHKNWLVRAYFGPSPESTPGLAKVEFTACAVALDVGSGDVPCLTGIDCAVRVDFDQRSVVWMSASTRPALTRKLQKAFNGFHWIHKP